MALIVGGILLRLTVLGASYGSNDMGSWERFAAIIKQHGLWETYRLLRGFNHPPLMGLLAAGLNEFATWSDIPFRVWWKLPPFFADLFAMRLLWIHFAPRGRLWAAASVATFSCNPISIAVTAFHGNTDSICAVLALYAALLHRRGRFAAAGVALAGAANVKVIALIFAPGYLLLCATPFLMLRFIGGFSLGCLPLGLALLVAPNFYTNVFGYDSQITRWGVSAWALHSQQTYPALYRFLAIEYRAAARGVVLGLTLVLAFLARRRRWSAARLGSVTMSSFLFLTPGFGVQYLVWLVPLLAAVSLRYSAWWAVSAGSFLLLTYDSFMTGEWPLRSVHRLPIGEPMGLLGLIAWVVLGVILYRELAQQCAEQFLRRVLQLEDARNEGDVLLQTSSTPEGGMATDVMAYVGAPQGRELGSPLGK
jgi:hypothetical protein